MTYRPYPSVVRARHQIERQAVSAPVPVPAVSPTVAQFAAAMGQAFQPNADRIMANVQAVVAGMPKAADLACGMRSSA